MGITMCGGDGCSLKSTCYRHTAVANTFRQSYFVTSPVDAKDSKSCLHYTCNKEVVSAKRNSH